MPGLFATPIPPDGQDLRWSAREVIVDRYDRPHLMLRVTLTGASFPHRALEPYVTIGEVRSRFVRISTDGSRADAYFEVDRVGRGEIRFGHGDTVEAIVPDRFDSEAVRALDRERLPPGTVVRFEDPGIR